VRDSFGSIVTEGTGGGVAVLGSHNIVFIGNTVVLNVFSSRGYGKSGGLGFTYCTNDRIRGNETRENITSTAAYSRGGGVFLRYADDAMVTNRRALPGWFIVAVATFP
jgi:hypothetical protein